VKAHLVVIAGSNDAPAIINAGIYEVNEGDSLVISRGQFPWTVKVANIVQHPEELFLPTAVAFRLGEK